MIELDYSLSDRFPDPPQTDYRNASVRSLRYDLFCGDIFLEADGLDLSTAWGWVPVLDFAWALCDSVEELDRDTRGSRSAAVQTFDLDFTQNTELLRFARRFGLVEISATWLRDTPPAVVRHAELRREARDFLQDVIADLTELHEGLGDNPNIWSLQGKFPRV
ncbi:hypothetical protein [Kitasatospora sp. GP82]|uniref:hypothetical protein n=1 Tax=Kitasatospora sp. GP82 TaxID=3035089 RepID=UPI0024766B65|nr:hypothetical protein [Kitasatospora sp. GP82]